MVIHVVKPGESLYSIATEYGISMSQIYYDNGLQDPSHLVVGQTLVIRFPREMYTVQPGDTLFMIAQQAGVTVNQLYRNNPVLGGEPELQLGQHLVLNYQQEADVPIHVNGYTYTDITARQLHSVLPFLSEITPFTYGFTPEGALISPDDQRIVDAARQYGVRPMLHLSTLTQEGGFSNQLAHIALTDLTVQTRLIAELKSEILRKGYRGFDIDFEYVYPEDAQAYAQFVARIREVLSPMKIPVTVALAPKTSAEQPGALYEGHDYRALSDAADFVLLMTYEWGYTYGPPMAVAPLPNVRKVVEYALREMPAEKIYLGIPNYGYDWTLPYRRGSRARSISNREAVALAERYRVSIQYNESVQSPTFRYVDEEGLEHEVWFEDARSIEAKLALVKEYGLYGAGYWNLNRPFPQNWPLLDALFRIRQDSTEDDTI